MTTGEILEYTFCQCRKLHRVIDFFRTTAIPSTEQIFNSPQLHNKGYGSKSEAMLYLVGAGG